MMLRCAQQFRRDGLELRCRHLHRKKEECSRTSRSRRSFAVFVSVGASRMRWEAMLLRLMQRNRLGMLRMGSRCMGPFARRVTVQMEAEGRRQGRLWIMRTLV